MNTVYTSEKVLIFGCGNMGGSFLKAMVEKGIYLPSQIKVIEKNISPLLETYISQGVQVKDAVDNLEDRDFSIIFLCVKPQDLVPSTQQLQKIFINLTSSSDLSSVSNASSLTTASPLPVLISCLAGTPTESLSRSLGGYRHIIRCMPNLPIQISQGVIGYYACPEIPNDKVLSISTIFDTLGYSFKVKEEDQLNGVTAMSGSGTGYIAYFMNAFLKAALELGFTSSEAKNIIISTFKGCADLWQSESDISPKDIQVRVTSPNGTTATAIKVFDEYQTKEAIIKGIIAANVRAKELSKA